MNATNGRRRHGHSWEDANLHFQCPRCDESFVYQAYDIPPRGTTLECPHCRLQFRNQVAPPSVDAPLERCWLCGGDRFYVQKDINRELTVLLAICSLVIAILVVILVDAILGLLCLGFFALVAGAIQQLLASCTVCYVCRSIYRGFRPNPGHRRFYLVHQEKLRTHREDWLREILRSP